MTTCDEIRSNSLALSALVPGDAGREAALSHARACPGCDAALREGARLLALIDAGLRPLPPAETALQRARGAVLAELERDLARRSAPEWRSPIVFAASAALAFALFTLASRQRAPDLSSWVLAAAAASLAALLAGLSGRGASTLLAAVGGAFAFALIAGESQGLAPLIGLKCTAIELVAACVPFAVAALSRGAVPRPVSPAPAAALAAAAALAGQAALHLTCPVRHALPHLLAFHLAGVVLAAILGAGVLRARAS